MKTLMLILNIILQASDASVSMADALRKSGKIYVVVLVFVIIAAGLFTYLWLTDKKISKLENRDNEPTKF